MVLLFSFVGFICFGDILVCGNCFCVYFLDLGVYCYYWDIVIVIAMVVVLSIFWRLDFHSDIAVCNQFNRTDFAIWMTFNQITCHFMRMIHTVLLICLPDLLFWVLLPYLIIFIQTFTLIFSHSGSIDQFVVVGLLIFLFGCK